MPATTNGPDPAQLRTVLDLAIDIGVRKFLARAKAAHLETSSGPTDAQKFKKQVKNFDE
jgi:hypothetical protein